jgi:sirohydrochlorin ferrochelatase/(2Fe-2S) ferredoxin
LELAPPHASEAIDAAVASGADEVVVVPAVLLAAGHAKNDVPVLVNQARLRHPGVKFFSSRPLGVNAGMLSVLHDRLTTARQTLGPCDDDRVAVLLLGRGSSDPDANADIYKIGRLLTERQGLLGHEVGFIGVTQPDVETAFKTLAARRPRQIVVMPYLLYPGVLVERVRKKAADLAALYRRLEVRVTEPVGTHPSVLDVLLERADESVRGVGGMSCDTCKYRAPLPGFTHEVGGLQALRKAKAHVEIPASPDVPPHAHIPPRKHVLVCVNRDCVDRGSLATLDRFRRRIRADRLGKRIQTTRVMCVGRCGEGPAVCVYPDGVWYRKVSADDADLIYEQHLREDRPVGHLIDQVLSGT